jgi:hypothetical protein
MYFFCFLLGLGYTIISFVLQDGQGADSSHDVSAGTTHADTSDGSGYSLDGAHPDFPLFSPLTIALSMTIFGGVGTLLNLLKFPGYLSFPVSAVTGLLGWLGTFYVFFKLFRITQSSSEALVHQLVGKEANVTVAIPPNGLGEISYIARGTRYNVPARSKDKHGLSTGSRVVIAEIDNGVYVVSESVEEKLSRL